MSRLAPSGPGAQLGSSPSSPMMASDSALASAAAATTLLGRQVAAIRQMLRLNSDAAPGSAAGPQWTVLVFDRVGQDLLAPVMNVKALRDEGVTLHLYIMSDRDPVPEVPAIYFCQPSEDNLRRIGDDLRAGLYGSYHFNFISPIQRGRLEELASAAIQANAVQQVQKLYDQYVNFICLENEMFTLRHQNSSSLSYHALNRASVTEVEMEGMLSQIVDSLFAVCVTLGVVPIIRCPRGNAAEAVAVKLDKKLRENLRDARNTLFVSDGIQAGQYSFYRPLLVLLDRQFDLATPLHHTWTYQALAHDVLKYSLNRVSIVEPPDASAGPASGRPPRTRECDLDSADAFWAGHKGLPFPSVAEDIQGELEDYRAREDDIKRMKHEMGVADGEEAAMGLISDNTQRLTSAVSSLPALLEKKRLIDMHTSIATAILEQIKLRKLDAFFELEEKLMAGKAGGSGGGQGAAAEAKLAELVADEESGTPEDKLRLVIIHFLCSPGVGDEDVDRFAATLEAAGCDVAALKYLRRFKSLQKMASGQTTLSMSNAADYQGGGTKTISMFSKLMNQGSSFVMEGVKNLVVKKHNLPATKIVEELMEARAGQHQDDFRYLDPKILRGNADNVPRAKGPFQEAVVFMVGGGNYIEYQNLMDYAAGGTSGVGGGVAGLASASTANLAAMAGGGGPGGGGPGGPGGGNKRIIYGCTTLVNANQMMQQLAELGHEM